MNPLSIESRLTVQAMRHGAGFQAFGIRGADSSMDPYLMADHYRMWQPTFGPHPHAGFSAVTYMFDDAETGFLNRDSLGDRSEIRAGDCHWTVAGAGVVHEEVPVENDKVAHGLQIFVNLAAQNKHIAPRAIHIRREEMPRVVQPGGARVKVAFGTYDDGASSVPAVTALPTEAALFDVLLESGTSFRYRIAAGLNAFIVVVDGVATIGSEKLEKPQAAAFGRAGGELVVSSDDGAHFALFLGKPFDEPIVRHGPFAMTNQADIDRAVEDFRAGRMGTL
jgi:redox-sensitive bicupin YhaK (pirin superfamily)